MQRKWLFPLVSQILCRSTLRRQSEGMDIYKPTRQKKEWRHGFYLIATAFFLVITLFPVESRAQTTVEYIHTDALGSPVVVTDASGNVIEREVYEPYGSPITRPPSDQPGFTGHMGDSLTNLTYMQQRYYDPQIGRFLSVDPVTAHDMPLTNFNRYVYARNNPYKFTDPDGRLWWLMIPTVVGMLTYSDNANAPGPNDTPSSRPAGEQIAAAIPGGRGVGASIRTVANMTGKTYTTYTRKKSDGTIYSGRTSGKGTPEQQVAARTSQPDHQTKTAEGYGPGRVDKNSPNADAIRGREQQLIDKNGGAQSQGGTSGNAINGVSPSNPNQERYQQACNNEFAC